MNTFVYFDARTTIIRGYLVDETGALIDCVIKESGSRNSATAAGSKTLTSGLYEVYTMLLIRNKLTDSDVESIYASGMVSSPYGIKEIPHVPTPVSIPDLAAAIVPCREDKYFHRDIFVIPGVRSSGDGNIEYVNNMRWEETVVLGAMPKIQQAFPNRPVCAVIPGAHTHMLLVQDNKIMDCLAHLTGEILSAIQNHTILAPILNAPVSNYDPDMIHQGVQNLQKYGLTRALYICHAMRLFSNESAARLASYGQGVILGSLCQSLDCYIEEKWIGLRDLVIISSPKNCSLYKHILSNCRENLEIKTLETSSDWNPSFEGMRSLHREHVRLKQN